MNGRMVTLVAIVGFGLGVAEPVAAQVRPPARRPALERVEQIRKLRLMEALHLDEETSIRFFTRYNRHQNEMRELQQQREALISELERLRDANASDAEIQKALNEIRSYEQRVLEARMRYWDELKEVLTTKQLASYWVFESQFNRMLRETMREIQEERMQRRLR